MKEYPWGKGTVKWERDATANDSDKSFTTPAGKIRVYTMIRAHITATATVGNRILMFTLTDGTNVLFASGRTGNVTASNTGLLVYSPDLPYSTTSGAGGAMDDGVLPSVGACGPIPALYAPAGYVLRVWDKSAVDAAADDMTVDLQYVEYDA